MLFRFLYLALFLGALTGCSTSSVRESIRFPASTADEHDPLAAYHESVAALQADFSAQQPRITSERHYPRLYLHGEPTETVVVLMHGLYESPFNVRGLAQNFFNLGANVVTPLLAHHWVSPLEDLNNADYREWLEQYLAIVKTARGLGKKVILAGHSTGGLLAVYTAIQRPELADGLCLWSPALALTYITYYGAWLSTWTQGRIDVDYNKLAGKPPPDPVKVAYYSAPAGNEVSKLADFLLEDYANTHPFSSRPSWWVKKSAYASAKVPVFLVRPEKDEVVSSKEMDYFYDSLTSPKLRLILGGENHSSTPKGPGDNVEGVQTANRDFSGMVEKLNAFYRENFKAPAGAR